MSEQEEKILHAAKSWEVPESRSKEEIWNALEKEIKENRALAPSKTTGWAYRWAAAAVVVLIVIGAIFGFFFQRTLVSTGVAEVKTLELPDGSVVTMNANSELSYTASLFTKYRRLEFKGEGYFDIRSGEDFIINLDGIAVAVLGTTFNIYARNEIHEVKCITGSVEVSSHSSTIALKPGQSISYQKEKLDAEPVKFDITEAISWQEGKFSFKNAPLTRVVNELEIQFGVRVLTNGIEDRYYTGYFDNTNLEKAVKQVFSPMGYSYEISDNEILIR